MAQVTRRIYTLLALFITTLPGWAAAQSSQDDILWHDMGATDPYGYEWFYFDMEAADGTTIAISFHAPNAFDPSLGALALLGLGDASLHVGMLVQVSYPSDYFDSELAGKVFDIREYLYGDGLVDFSLEPYFLKVGNNVLTRDSYVSPSGLERPVYSLSIDTTDFRDGTRIKGEFTLKGLRDGWKVGGDGYTYVDDPTTTEPAIFHKWVVVMPRAKADGAFEIEFANKNPVYGAFSDAVGYHDHNWGSVPLFVSNPGWLWGRASNQDGTLIVVRMHEHPLTPSERLLRGVVFYAAPDGEVLIDEADYYGEPEKVIFERSQQVLASNTVAYNPEISVSFADEELPWEFDFTFEESILESFPAYLRAKYRLEVDSADSQGAKEHDRYDRKLHCDYEKHGRYEWCDESQHSAGKIVIEYMDLPKLGQWYWETAFRL